MQAARGRSAIFGFVGDELQSFIVQDWLGVGGWAGGEVGLKEAKTLELKPGTRVRVKGEPAEWKKNGIFSGNPSFRFAGARIVGRKWWGTSPTLRWR